MITYIPNFLKNADLFFERIKNETKWIRVGSIPRSEYWCNDGMRPYTYGRGNGIRTYEAQPWTFTIMMVRELLNSQTSVYYEGCFSNYYRDSSDHLGWHADDDPNINHDKPIAVVSLGAEREIWYRENDASEKTALLLQHGSLFLMPAGFQYTHQHRIPKASRQDVGPRISLTFRSLVSI